MFVFSKTVPCKEETNMAVASMMTCKTRLDMTSHENHIEVKKNVKILHFP